MDQEIRITLHADEDGYMGRECPEQACLGYFKVTPGTGITVAGSPCHCPYCGHEGDPNTFFTQEQIEHGKSIALRAITQGLQQHLKGLEFNHRPRGHFGIGISLKVKTGPLPPIRTYREKQLETQLVCDTCTLRYTIYGVFSWCPDCATHNSLQMLQKNMELAQKELDLSKEVSGDLATHLITDALKTVVSTFDGFGRELTSVAGKEVSFQNLQGSRRNMLEQIGIDIATLIDSADWSFAVMSFQKRHLFEHAMGVVEKSTLSGRETIL